MTTTAEILNKKRPTCQVHKSIEGFCEHDVEIMLDEARADTIKIAIAHMRVARSGMCLKDRAVLLEEINYLESEL